MNEVTKRLLNSAIYTPKISSNKFKFFKNTEKIFGSAKPNAENVHVSIYIYINIFMYICIHNAELSRSLDKTILGPSWSYFWIIFLGSISSLNVCSFFAEKTGKSKIQNMSKMLPKKKFRLLVFRKCHKCLRTNSLNFSFQNMSTK